MGVYIPNMEKPKSCYNHCLEDFIANEGRRMNIALLILFVIFCGVGGE